MMAWGDMFCECPLAARCCVCAVTDGSTELDAEKRLALQEEKQELEQRLLEVPKLRARLDELYGIKSQHALRV